MFICGYSSYWFLLLGRNHFNPRAVKQLRLPGASDELADRVSAVEEEVGAVGGVVDHGVLHVDAELVIERVAKTS